MWVRFARDVADAFRGDQGLRSLGMWFGRSTMWLAMPWEQRGDGSGCRGDSCWSSMDGQFSSFREHGDVLPSS